MSVHQLKSDPHFDSIGQAAQQAVARTESAMDGYDFWRRGLELGGGRQLSREQAASLSPTTDPQSGFFRKRNKRGKDVAVAIWHSEQGMIALADGEPTDPDAIWTYCLSWPISSEQYEAVVERGEPWPDDGPERTIGDNLPDDPHEAAKIEFEGEKEAAEEILRRPIKTQADADRAAVASKRLSDLHGKVDKMFRSEKDPIVVAGREVDEKFRWREEVKALSTKLKQAQTSFLSEQDRLEKERQRRAREEADRIRREAEEKARRAAAEASRASDEERARLQREADEAAAQAAAKEREAQEQKVSAGRTGAKVSLRTYYVARVTDYEKLVLSLKDTPEVREAVEKVAASIARSKGPVPEGMERVEERRAA